MSVVNVIEIMISIILFIAVIFIQKKKKSNKVLAVLIFMNVTVLVHLGISHITWSEKNNTLVQKTVSAQEVQDDISPIICLKGEKNITLKDGECYQEAGYSAVDNYDGSIVKRVKVEKQLITENQYKLVYTVTDSSGNQARDERMIRIEQKENLKKTSEQEESNKKQSVQKGIIYLTFDDGPSYNSTPLILDILKEEEVKATFFVLNYDNSTEYLIKRELEEGHSVGIHGYSHEYSKIYQSVDAYMKNLNQLQSKIYKSTGVKTTITRFPGGSSNTISSFNHGIMTKLSEEVGKYGYQYCDWNVDSEDSGGAKDAKTVYKNVTNNLRKDRRNVVLMHDFASNYRTIDALKDIIEYGKKNGYIFETITPDTEMVQHSIFN